MLTLFSQAVNTSIVTDAYSGDTLVTFYTSKIVVRFNLPNALSDSDFILFQAVAYVDATSKPETPTSTFNIKELMARNNHRKIADESLQHVSESTRITVQSMGHRIDDS